MNNSNNNISINNIITITNQQQQENQESFGLKLEQLSADVEACLAALDMLQQQQQQQQQAEEILRIKQLLVRYQDQDRKFFLVGIATVIFILKIGTFMLLSLYYYHYSQSYDIN